MLSKRPIWVREVRVPVFGPLLADTVAEVCVIGAGIAGLTVAYLLSVIGKRVVVIEDGEIGSGMTGLTTAHLTCVVDRSYRDIERLRGKSFALLAAQSHIAAINRIEATIAHERIACDFRRVTGFLVGARDGDAGRLEEELAALHRAGVSAAVLLDRPSHEGFGEAPCLAVPEQAQFHPMKYVAGLARAIRRHGGKIFTQTHADVIEGGDEACVRAGKHAVRARAVVVATNTPVNDVIAMHTKQAPYTTYAIAAAVENGSVAPGLYWDTLDPYHYVRLQQLGTREYIIVGGEDHKSGQAGDTAERFGRLEEWARPRFPTLRKVEFAWAGQVMESLDGLGYIGRNPLDADNVYVVTGDSGTGMTHGTIAGILLTDLVLGRRNPWEKLYDPARKPVRALRTFARENANMAAQFADWLKPGEVADPKRIPRGSGAVVRDGLRMIAAYRDDDGRLHQTSAVCNHLGCIVHWNQADSTWDCPCHGSRFDRFGAVLNGPANRNLAPVTPAKMRTG